MSRNEAHLRREIELARQQFELAAEVRRCLREAATRMACTRMARGDNPQYQTDKELLKAKVAQLAVDAATNEVLRSEIQLLDVRINVWRMEVEPERERPRADRQEIEALRQASQIRIETRAEEVRMLEEKRVEQNSAHDRRMRDLADEQAEQRAIHERKMSILRDEASQQRAIVDQQARAWQLEWIEEAAAKKKQQQAATALSEKERAEEDRRQRNERQKADTLREIAAMEEQQHCSLEHRLRAIEERKLQHERESAQRLAAIRERRLQHERESAQRLRQIEEEHAHRVRAIHQRAFVQRRQRRRVADAA